MHIYLPGTVVMPSWFLVQCMPLAHASGEGYSFLPCMDP